ncbi:MAG TPA: HU family DNA-binding protein [Blastocatellia bacterium]|nr:HU family DNA-binding protein [Blastocatellia bacterium]
MNRGHLIARVAKKAKVSKVAADQMLDVVFAEMADALKRGEKVVIKDLMTLSVSVRQARNGRNPQTGEPITIEEKKSLRAKPGKKLDTMLNKRRFEEVLREGIGRVGTKKSS